MNLSKLLTNFLRWDDTSLWKHPLQFLPFYTGIKCIGRHIAFKQTKIVIAMIVRKFKIKVGQKPAPEIGPVLQSKNGVVINVEIR